MATVVHLSEEGFAALENELRCLILNERRLDLLRLQGLLRLRGKLWQGDIVRIDLFESAHDHARPNVEDSVEESKSPALTCIAVNAEPITSVAEPFITKEMREKMKIPPSTRWNVCLLKHRDDLDVVAFLNRNFIEDYFMKAPLCNENRVCSAGVGERRVLIVHQWKFWEGIKDFYKSQNVVERVCCMLAYLPKDENLAHFEVPEGYEIREIDLNQLFYAMEHYQHSSETILHVFASSAQYGLAIGAFPIGAKLPVSWIFCNESGTMSAFETLPDFRRKGLGKAVFGKLAEKIISMGLRPHSYIQIRETAMTPTRLVQSLGFELLANEQPIIARSTIVH